VGLFLWLYMEYLFCVQMYYYILWRCIIFWYRLLDEKRPMTNRFHKNYNILFTKEDSILSTSFYLLTLCNFTSNFYIPCFILYVIS